MEMRTQPKDMVALTTLGLLSEQPFHPYEIQRLLRERHKSYAVGKTRTLYRAIEELESAGYIEPIETSREGRRPERTVYRITPEGSEELENWLADLLSTPVDETPAFRVAVGLLGYITQERAEAALARRVVGLRARVASLEAALGMAQEDLGLPRLVLLELEHAIALDAAEIEWIRSITADMHVGALVWNEELIRAHFDAMHAADAERRNRHREHHLAKLLHPTRREHPSHTPPEGIPID
jgi:DNA-binding PadR family transcriptional regulator